MIYAKLDVTIIGNWRRLQCGAAAFGLWSWGLAYCREQETDGVIPFAAMKGAFPDDDGPYLAEVLCSSGLWERGSNCFRMKKYAEKNETKEEISKRRAQTKDRVTRYRNVTERVTNADCNAVVPGSDSVFVKSLSLEEGSKGETGSVLSESTDPPEATKTQKREAWEQTMRVAYCRGIAEGKSGPFAWPGGLYDQGALNESVAAFGRKRDGGRILGDVLPQWLEAKAADFAEDVVRRGKSEFYSGFSPKGFKKWLNEQISTSQERKVS